MLSLLLGVVEVGEHDFEWILCVCFESKANMDDREMGLEEQQQEPQKELEVECLLLELEESQQAYP